MASPAIPPNSFLSDDEEDALSSPASYSSCDGYWGRERGSIDEGDDRYCSANSVLGSASLCSSLGHHNDLQLLAASPLTRTTAVAVGVEGAEDDDAIPSPSPSPTRSFDAWDGHIGGAGSDCCSSDGVVESLSQHNVHGYPHGMSPSPRFRFNTAQSPSSSFASPTRESSSQHFKPSAQGGDTTSTALVLPASQDCTSGSLVVHLQLDGETGERAPKNHSHRRPSVSGNDGTVSRRHSLLTSSASKEASGATDNMMSPVSQRPASHQNHVPNEMMLENVDGNTSGYDLSEGDDSFSGSGMDDAVTVMMHPSERKYFSHSKETADAYNPFLMNSSVAFGSGDWDEFMQEASADDPASLTLFQEQPAFQLHDFSDVKGSLSQPSLDHASAAYHNRINRKDEGDILQANSCIKLIEGPAESVSAYRVRDSLQDYVVPPVQMPPPEVHFPAGQINLISGAPGAEAHSVCAEDIIRVDADGASKLPSPSGSELPLAPLYDTHGLQFCATSTGLCQGKDRGTHEIEKSTHLLQHVDNANDHIVESGAEKFEHRELDQEAFTMDEVKKPGASESYDETVLEMEEILLDSAKSPGHKFAEANQVSSTLQSCHFRDGSSTASTSGTDEAYPTMRYPPKIEWVEVVGAKQKKGDVSFGERLVGVKEYTVYKIRVWSGNEQWEVERRYRDFFSLYCQLRTSFADYGLGLPSPWSSVDRESRKMFGNASPSVVSERSTLIQDCLRSILSSKIPSSTASTLAYFLSPGEAVHSPSFLRALIPQSLKKVEDKNSRYVYFGETSHADVSTMGKTIPLILELKPHKSMRQLLEAQHYTCAGCHRHLDAGKTLLGELVQTFRWSKPRFCEYTGQLFCASCHTNDIAVLPAKVLHLWDFSLYPVSQLAKAYLDSIYEQPMLCVSAVNPFLFSKVPALLHVMGVRKKIGAMLPYLRCPFRRSIQRGLGFRRYLLEDNDFFALRDLVDLSKGAFAALPTVVETISSKIFEHITQQCLLCYDAGVPCAARQACDDPLSLIFPFQEAEATRCTLCGSIFHKPCFGKLMGCPCGRTRADTAARTVPQVVHGEIKSGGADGRFIQHHDSTSTSGFFTEFFSKAIPNRIWKPRKSSPVILMGSLPSTSL